MKMKYLIIILISLLIPFSISARNISELKISISDDMGADCNNYWALGCFNPNNQTIKIKRNLDIGISKMVLAHEVGHYFLQDAPLEEMERLFGGDKFNSQENAAYSFYYFIWIPLMLNNEQIMFFRELIANF